MDSLEFCHGFFLFYQVLSRESDIFQAILEKGTSDSGCTNEVAFSHLSLHPTLDELKTINDTDLS